MEQLLSLSHEKFAIAYLANNGNGTAAYQLAFPKASYNTAKNAAKNLLKQQDIKDYIANKRKELSTELNITLESQLRDLELVKDKYKELLALSVKEELTKEDKFQLEFLYGLLKVPNYVAAIAEQNRILGFHKSKVEVDLPNSEIQLYLPQNNRELASSVEEAKVIEIDK